VQNLSTLYAANVSLAFYWAVGTPSAGQLAATYTATIPAGGSQGWHLPSGDIPSVPAGFRGSLVVSSDQPLAVNANAEDTTGPVRKGTVRAIETPSTTLRFPQVQYQFWGWNSYLVLQNTSGSNATATIHYYNTTGGEVAISAESRQGTRGMIRVVQGSVNRRHGDPHRTGMRKVTEYNRIHLLRELFVRGTCYHSRRVTGHVVQRGPEPFPVAAWLAVLKVVGGHGSAVSSTGRCL